jgi:alkanesulfonate monooxygenase SsuD/methylene tetrahydromethanopterin reductase-like flavin-dependent oxidoreductase (luciferase family)
MEFGIFNLMGSRDPAKPTVEAFAEVAEQAGLADELGCAIAWFAEDRVSNYCLRASPLMMAAPCVWPPRSYHRFDRRVTWHP